eukprot:TRINITY_DN5972_c0_g1_i2.p1 TRINITY_DN5972_c0_g1~~TRINITY_DN5972_c0_g1_i2.p1  ORF type:complete len:425 (+),score=72.50 TRINITY_DN5972_c0_g1_i2:152-1276(+)
MDELGRSILTLQHPFALQLGGTLPSVSLSWEEWGPKDGPVVLIVPSLSSGSHVAVTEKNKEDGWWEKMVGPGKWIDTTKYRVISPNVLGSTYGLTSPASINPETGKLYGKFFPQITTADQASLVKLLLDHLQIDRIEAIIGASLGGMIVLQFAVHFADIAEKVVVISSTAKTTAGTVAIRSVQRAAVLADPDLCDGDYREQGKWPTHGMKVARMLGLISYRSRTEFDTRFNHRGKHMPNSELTDPLGFEVEEWLSTKSDPFATSYDPNSYLLLSKCMDLHNVSLGICPDVEQALQRITAKTHVIGVDTDYLIPVFEQHHIHQTLFHADKKCTYEELSSLYGHDAFLHQEKWFGPRLQLFLESGNPYSDGNPYAD